MLHSDIGDATAIDSYYPGPWTLSQFVGELDQAIGWHFIGTDNDHVVGYIIGVAVSGEAEIRKIAVDINVLAKGWGAALVRHSLSYLAKSGITRCFLEVRASNSSAQKLYTKCGFQFVGRRKKYYSAPEEDAIVMEKHMSPGACT